MLGVRGGSNPQSLLVRRVLGLDRGIPWAVKAIEPMVSADSGWTNVVNGLEHLNYSLFHEREQGSAAPRPTESQPPPLFLSVNPGMTVVVQDVPTVGQNSDGGWWMGDVISVDGGARDPRVPTLFQIADVDSGEIRWVNADCVTHVVPRC